MGREPAKWDLSFLNDNLLAHAILQILLPRAIQCILKCAGSQLYIILIKTRKSIYYAERRTMNEEALAKNKSTNPVKSNLNSDNLLLGKK